MNIKKNLIKTNDLYYASFLKTSGFLLDSIEKKDNKTFFIFEDVLNLKNKIQAEYINGSAKVIAKDLIDNMRSLKLMTTMQ